MYLVFFDNVIFVYKTIKSDWFTNYLYKCQFWVGGTIVSFNSDPATHATQTIRYFHSNEEDFLIVYILEFIEPLNKRIDYEGVIKEYISNIDLSPNFTLAIWPNQSHIFAIFENGKLTQNLDTPKVLETFKKYDSSLIGSATYLKPLNKSYTDFFHLWARRHMKGFQNDIDAFMLEGNQLHMLELKRPKESVNTWKPYRADMNNYLQFAKLCSNLKCNLTNIAYSEAEKGLLKIFNNVSISSQGLSYRTATVDIKPDENLLTKIRSLTLIEEFSNR